MRQPKRGGAQNSRDFTSVKANAMSRTAPNRSALPNLLDPIDWRMRHAEPKAEMEAAGQRKLGHANDCAFNLDQYPSECSCGLWDWTRPNR